MMKETDLPASSPVGSRIYTVRGKAVMLDSDLAEVYGVETKRINEAVKRNARRFTPAYTFQLLQDEWDILRSQIATSRLEGESWGGRRHLQSWGGRRHLQQAEEPRERIGFKMR